MKRKKTKNRTRTRGSLAVFLSAVIVMTAFVYCDNISKYFEKTALLSACILMPQGSSDYIKSVYNNGTENTGTGVFAEVIAGKSKNDSQSAIKNVENPLAVTPDDILKMMPAFETQYPIETKNGTVLEKQYSIQNATSSFKNITLRNTTETHSINIEASLEKQATLKITNKSEPNILIFHTHTTESYSMVDNGWYSLQYASRSNDSTRNMVRVGDAICEQLEAAGYNVIHDKTVYDQTYTGAYANSRAAVENYLKQYPSIQVVLDVHRDAIYQDDGTRVKPTATIKGKKAAQIMIIAGCEDGKVTGFPRWEENLTFALQLDKAVENEYSGLMRPILFSSRKYNMDLTPCSLLVEFGSDSNTLDEAVYSGRLFGVALSKMLGNYVQ